MQPLVSIIVPVYKVEDCLKRCLDCICNQSLSNIEIILVDDASPDRCGIICEEYAAKDARFRVFHHSENRGLSAARNTGIKYALAEYLMFVDSDDRVHTDFCKVPYECAVSSQADLVMFNYTMITRLKSFIKMKCNIDKRTEKLVTRSEALDLLENRVGNYAWNKLYRKALFEGVSYPEGCFYEDIGTTYKLVLKSSRIYYLETVLYYKYFRNESITTCRTKKALLDEFTMRMQKYHSLLAWGGYPAEKLEGQLKIIAMDYCVNKTRDLSDYNCVFCENVLRSCNMVPKEFTWKKKVLFVIFKISPSLLEMISELWGKKCDA